MEESFWNHSLSVDQRLWLGVIILIIVMIWFLKSYFSSESKLERKLERERKAQERKKEIEEVEKMRKVVQQIKQQEKENKRKEEYESYIKFRTKLEQMPRYETWKQEVINKCGNKCQLDKSHADRRTEVHHIESLYSIYIKNNLGLNENENTIKCKALWSIDNGIVLCKECHDTMESSKNRQILVQNK